ncbi:MAG: discoidin domain-containing protein, partial [Phycisphaeraceae bacterium]|nr:discoidin domain-containing protein [Phycisphaeraceae bacterium]
VYYDTSGPGYDRTSKAIAADEIVDAWNHWAFTKNADTGDVTIYRNGEVWHSDTGKNKPLQGADVTKFTIGTKPNLGEWWVTGMIDDVQLYNAELTQEEIEAAMLGIGNKALAGDPEPQDAGDDVLRDTDLSWSAGAFAGTHNLYLGESFEDVNNATAPTAGGLTATSYDAGRFDFGKTYFWRVDEVNATPDKTVFKGEIWSFIAEPYSIQIPGSTIAVTASSSSNEFSEPEKTIDGSGLGADDTHAMGPETMWFTAAVDLDPWIQYDFDDVKKLDIMKVWNSNSSAEIAIGWGVKDVIIEYSVDGENWDALDPAQLSRAPGSPAYKEYDSVDFGGVPAKHVRLDIENNWGGILMSYGISEAQFYMIPAEAREPDPASGAVVVIPSTVAQWRAGREAAQHTIYVSTDANAVADGTALSVTSNTNSLDLASLDLDLGATYYWRVDEVNEAEAVSVWAGPVWSLSTVAALTVDDFESYGNVSPDRPFQTWLDGFGYSADEFFPQDYPGNGTGAGIGHDIWSLSSPHYDGDIMETASTIPGSGQSLPFYYSNSGGVASQTDRTFAAPQDWTVGGVQTLSIPFRGQEGNTGTLYVKINNTKITYPHDPADIGVGVSWQAWNIDLSAMDVQSVTSFHIGVDGASASGMVLIDDLKLYPTAGELLTPVAPPSGTLTGAWSFDEGSGTVAVDSSGNGYNGTIVDGAWEAGQAGSALAFNGLSSQVALPAAAWNTIEQQVTVSLWAYVDSGLTQSPVTFAAYQDPANGNSRVINTHIVWSNGNLYFDAGGDGAGYDRINQAAPAEVYGDAWIHWAFTKNAGTGEMKVYRNGMLWLIGTGLDRTMTGVTSFTLGAANDTSFWSGSIDEFQLYDTELSQEEILWLAGARDPIDKPF